MEVVESVAPTNMALAVAIRERDAARADAKALAHWGAQLAHLALGLKTGRDRDQAIGEWEKAIAAHKEATK